ncbi:polysaccharide pyruvyl transferase family protein [Aliiroseovarius sp. YM-037]|uniref:polysaccharide pyruvyl transferase family protein n=1 Tax=Aliiroseovarius sp. YM-037 TaxID=3341728 RepID=UPI003A810CF4
MKLTYFQGDPPNFGDELNKTMWQHFLPDGFLDEDESTLFVGVGSLIQNIYPKAARKIVVGSGYGGYTPMPDISDGMWEFSFVRGPQTAEMLGLDPALAIADSAILLRETPLPTPADGIGVAFMPHYESIERGDWQRVCELAGVHFIDPSKPPEQVISEILGADLLIAEAMHGAIVADALRTPWIGVRTMNQVHRFKWYDFTRSLNIDYRPAFLFPSNGREGWAATTGRSGSGPKARAFLGGPLARPLNVACHHIAARSMQNLAKIDPQLSADSEVERATGRAVEAVDGLVRKYSRDAA